MKRLTMAIVVILGLVVISPIAYQTIGFFVRCVNDACTVEASTSLLAIGLGALFFLAIHLVPRQPFQNTANLVPFSRLAGAFILDLYIFFVSFSALRMLLPLIAESFYTGSFQWEFTRNFIRPTDTIINLVGSLLFLALFLYLRYRTNQRQRPTVGQYLMGYAAADGRSRLFEYR
ncbi:MAG: hypothetical protein IPJ90_20645 [Anaerolineaceae bacterium]|nr:hypothetical protein [Anaerolineaceae bacterium]